MPAAARTGDLTIHGGTIVAGAATVSINGRPAARQGDLHVCPMCNPGSPPPPHVGGPIAGGAATVSIEQMPAARVGDACVCSGPPDAIAAGEPTVQIGDGGGLVHIGGVGRTQIGGRGMTRIGGGRAAPSGSAPGRHGPIGRSVRRGAGRSEPASATSGLLPKPFLQVAICDAAGAPLAGAPVRVRLARSNPRSNDSAGRSRDALQFLPGDGCVQRAPLPSAEDHNVQLPRVFDARWSAGRGRNGETVRICASAAGIDDGTRLPVRVLRVSAASGDLTTVHQAEATVTGGRVDTSWTCELDPGHPVVNDGEAARSGVFVAEVGGIGPGQPARTGRLRCEAS